jgi:simple sugar transport system ATP-binding protein
MFLGRETMRPGFLGRLGFMDNKAMRAEARGAFDKLGATVRSLDAPVGSMSGGQRQAIAIARAVHWASQVVFLDEPTAALGVRQTANVLDTIRRVAGQGVAVVLISHSMPHVMQVSDRVQVLRMGKRVAVYDTKDTSMEQLVGAMTGATGVAA